MFVKFNDIDRLFLIDGYANIAVRDGAIIVLRGKNIPKSDTTGFSFVELSSGEDGVSGLKIIEDCEDYKYQFDILSYVDGAAIYSNKKTIVETKDLSASSFYNPITPSLTQEDIEYMKIGKIEESKTALANFLETHPLKTTVHNGKPGVYSITMDKQTLMMSQFTTYQIEKQFNPEAKLTWNETGQPCEVWTEQEFLTLVLAIKKYVYPIVSYQQTLEMMINNATTEEELDNIRINYSTFIVEDETDDVPTTEEEDTTTDNTVEDNTNVEDEQTNNV